MVQGRKTHRELYKPYLVSLFTYTGNVEVSLTHEFSQEEILQLTANDVSRWLMWKAYMVPLHLAQKTILLLAVAPYLHKQRRLFPTYAQNEC